MPRSYESNKPPGGCPAFRDMMMVARKASKEKRLGATL
jgi:hypothetical protein